MPILPQVHYKMFPCAWFMFCILNICTHDVPQLIETLGDQSGKHLPDTRGEISVSLWINFAVEELKKPTMHGFRRSGAAEMDNNGLIFCACHQPTLKIKMYKATL